MKKIKSIFVKVLKFLHLYKYRTATDILIDLGIVNYIEPRFDENQYYDDIFISMENQMHQLQIDFTSGFIPKRIFNKRKKELTERFLKERNAYISKLEVVLI